LAIPVLTLNKFLWLKFLKFYRITYSPPPSRCSQGSSWIIDSGCTNHMTGEQRMFSSYMKNEDP
jgi:hypothetical protein